MSVELLIFSLTILRFCLTELSKCLINVEQMVYCIFARFLTTQHVKPSASDHFFGFRCHQRVDLQIYWHFTWAGSPHPDISLFQAITNLTVLLFLTFMTISEYLFLSLKLSLDGISNTYEDDHKMMTIMMLK